MPASRGSRGLVLVITLAHLAVVLPHLGRESLWRDEMMGLLVAQADPAWVRSFFLSMPEQHPLYYVLLKGWLLFGTSEVALRSLSVLFGALVIPASYSLMRRLHGHAAGIVTATMLALSPFLVYYGQEARMYTLLAFLAVVATDRLVHLIERPGTGQSIAYGAVAVLGVYTHFFFWFLLSAHLAAAALHERRIGPVAQRVLLAGGVVGLLYLPWAWLMFTHFPDAQGWKTHQNTLLGVPYTFMRFSLGYGVLVAGPGWKERGLQLVRDNWLLLSAAGLTCAILLTAGLRAAWGQGDRARTLPTTFAVPILLAVFGSAVVILVGERYLIVTFPFYMGLLALGWLSFLRSPSGAARTMGVVLGCLYVAATARGLYGQFRDPAFGKEQWRDVATTIAAQSRDGDTVIVFPAFVAANLEYYLRGRASVSVVEAEDLAGVHAFGSAWLVLAFARPEVRRARAPWLDEVPSARDVLAEWSFPKATGIRVLRVGGVRGAPPDVGSVP